MEKLIQGIRKFQTQIHPQKETLFHTLAEHGQKPQALFITCSDSRIDPALLTQTEPGDLFVIRNAGNIVPPFTENISGEAATIEYAITVLNVKDIIVCGHYHCGAITHLLEYRQGPSSDNPVPLITQWLKFADSKAPVHQPSTHCLSQEEKIILGIENNIILQLQHLKTHPAVARGLSEGNLSLHGWLYDFTTGTLKIYSQDKNSFLPIEEKSDIPQSNILSV